MYVSHKALAETYACRMVLLSAHALPSHVFPTVDQIIDDGPFSGHIALTLMSRIRQPPQTLQRTLSFTCRSKVFHSQGRNTCLRGKPQSLHI